LIARLQDPRSSGLAVALSAAAPSVRVAGDPARQSGRIERRTALRFRVVGIADMKMGSAEAGWPDPAKVLAAGPGAAGLPGAEHRRDALADPRVPADVMAEATFTNPKPEPAIGHVRAALMLGRSVVTNKPAALALGEMQALATQHGAQFRYEGTVMSGTPVIAWRNGLPATRSGDPRHPERHDELHPHADGSGGSYGDALPRLSGSVRRGEPGRRRRRGDAQGR
jgi:hypothetical protein